MSALLTVPVAGTAREKVLQGQSSETVTLPVRVRRASWVYNDFNQADTLNLQIEYRDAGMDPRFLSGATVEFYLGDADPDTGLWERTPEDLRFVGVMVKPARSASDAGFELELEFRDYTTLFIETGKKFPAEGVPHYGEDLAQAWARICDHVGPRASDGTVFSTVAALRDRIVFEGGLSGPPRIGSAVHPRIASFGRVQVKPNTDAWATWQRCVQMLGLISYIRGDECVVTTATNYYTSSDPPRFVWGQNILEMHEERNAAISPKGIVVQSYDTLTDMMLEAYWPPIGDPKVKKKTVVAKVGAGKSKKKAAPTQEAIVNGEDREFISYPGVTDPERLEEIAKRIYAEHSRQEMRGSVTTREMGVTTAGRTEFDLLKLRAGDDIRVEFDPASSELLKNLGSSSAQIEYLVARGYPFDVARIMVGNMREFSSQPSTFFVTSVNGTLEIDQTGGSFEVHVDYCNSVDINGAANAA